jgi:hypothetical protein
MQNIDEMIIKAMEVIANKLGCHYIDSEAVFTFANGKQAIVERKIAGEHLKLIFENEVIYEGKALNNMRTVAYDLIVLGYENM